MSTYVGPRSSRGSGIHYTEPPAYYTSSRGAPSVVYNDSRSDARDPRVPRSSSRSRRHSVSSGTRPIMIPRSHSPPPRSSVDFGGHSPPGRRSSIRISDSTGGPRNSSASLRRHDDRDDRDRTRPGTTRFPRKFVNREAVEEAGWPFEEDRETGAIVVFKALSKKEIDALVERTAYIRKRRAEGGPTTPALKSHHSSRHTEDRDKHVAFSPEKTTIIHQADAPPKSISAAAPVATRYLSKEEQRRREEELEDLSRKAKSEMEARMRAEEVARTVRSEAAASARGYGGGRRLSRDIVVR